MVERDGWGRMESFGGDGFGSGFGSGFGFRPEGGEMLAFGRSGQGRIGFGQAEPTIDLVRLRAQGIQLGKDVAEMGVSVSAHDLLVFRSLAGDQMTEEELGVAPSVVDAHGGGDIFDDDVAPGHQASVGSAAETAGVGLGAGGDHGPVHVKVGHQPSGVVSIVDVAVHQTGHAMVSTDAGDHPQLVPDGAFPGPHGRGPTVDGQTDDAGLAQLADQLGRAFGRVQQANLDADPNRKGRADVGD